MRSFLLFILSIGFCFLLTTSCEYNSEEELYPETKCDTLNVSFKNDIEPIIENNCAISGCHVAGGNAGGIYNNYTRIKAKVDNGSMRERVVVQQNMPPPDKGSITDCQIDKIDSWIDQGAPNN